MKNQCLICDREFVEDDWYECEECGLFICDDCTRFDHWGPLCDECYPVFGRDENKELLNVQPGV